MKTFTVDVTLIVRTEVVLDAPSEADARATAGLTVRKDLLDAKMPSLVVATSIREKK